MEFAAALSSDAGAAIGKAIAGAFKAAAKDLGQKIVRQITPTTLLQVVGSAVATTAKEEEKK